MCSCGEKLVLSFYEIKKGNGKNLPKCSNKSDDINARQLKETTSPILAANGVAKLSGFSLYR